MLLMGDEVRRTQRGNNNAYCQDSEISWFDWSLLERHADIHRFVKALNAFRQRRDVVAEGATLTLNQLLQPGANRVARRGARPARLERPLALPRLHAAEPACALPPPRHVQRLLGAADVRAAAVPADRRRAWRRCIDTALASPDDICPWGKAPVVRERKLSWRPAPWSFWCCRFKMLPTPCRTGSANDHPSSRRQARSRRLLVDVDRLRKEYYTRKPDIADRAQRVSFGTSGHRGSSLARRVQRGARPGDHAGDLRLPQRPGHHRSALSSARTRTRCPEPAFATALEVLAANGVETMIDRDERLYADAGDLPRHPRPQPRPDVGSGRRHRHHAVAQSAGRRRLQIQPAARRTRRHRCHALDRRRGQPAAVERISRRCRGSLTNEPDTPPPPTHTTMSDRT